MKRLKGGATLTAMAKRVSMVFGLVLSTSALRADVTIRYKNDYNFASFLPPEMMGQALQQAAASMPQSSVIQVKGNKGYSNSGKLISILDFGKQEITLVDAGNKRFTTLPMKDYAERMGAAMPVLPSEAQNSMASMKTNFSSRKTGRTDVIQGVEAEESETVLSMDVPETTGTLPAGPLMKMVMQVWTAKAEEALRVPAVRQWVGYTAYTNYLLDPVTAMQKMFANMPGLGQGLDKMLAERSKGLVLKSHAEMYMPMLAMLSRQLEKEGTAPPAGLDPKAPILEMNIEIVELSTTPVDDSVFQLPEDYRSAPIEDMMKFLIGPAGAASGATHGGQAPQRIRVDGHVQAANLITKVEPVYPPLAAQAGVEGTVRFTVTVDKEGHVANLQLLSGHPLLVAAAQDAVRQWVYRPTLLNGEPVAVVTLVEVSFARH